VFDKSAVPVLFKSDPKFFLNPGHAGFLRQGKGVLRENRLIMESIVKVNLLLQDLTATIIWLQENIVERGRIRLMVVGM
jgi:hypothetical protein